MKTISTSQYYIFLTLLIILLTGFLFQKPLSGEFLFGSPDSLSPSAIKQGIQNAERDYGEYPLWMPWVFSGLPSIHSFQNISEFYFPNFMVELFNLVGLPSFWNYVFHFIIMGLGIFLLLGQIGINRLCSIYGATSFVLMPYLITMVVHGHGSQMMTSSWIPWFIWGLLRIHAKTNIYNMGILGLVVGFQLQRAHVQIAYYTWMAAGLLICILLYSNYKNNEFFLKWLFFSFSSLFLGFCMSLSIYLPALNYTPFSVRGATDGGGAGIDYATAWSFSFGEMATFLIPSYYGFGGITYWGNMPFTDYPNYMGIIVILLAIIGSIFHSNKIKWYFILTSCLALLLSFGKHFFLYQIFYDFFPYFNKFRVPVMLLILTQFSVSILSAMGLEYVANLFNSNVNQDKSRIHKSLSRLSFIVGFLLLFIVYLKFKISFTPSFGEGVHPVLVQMRLDMINNDMYTVILFLLSVSIIYYFFYKKWISSNIFISLIIFISIFDLLIVDKKIIEPSVASYRNSTIINQSFKSKYLSKDEVINYLLEDTTKFRILPLDKSLASENRWSAFQIESISGYHPAKIYKYNLFKEKVGWSTIGLLQMLNVKYIISIEDFEHPAFENVFTGKFFNQGKYIDASVYKFKFALPRAYFTKEMKIVPKLDQQIRDLKRSDFNPVNVSIVDKKIKEIIYNENSKVNISRWSPNRIEIEVDVANPQFLVLSEVYYPNGWKITSHKDWKIVPVNMILRGLYIPSGNHNIVMEFVPNDIYYGNLFTLLSSIILIGCISQVWFRKKFN